MNKSIQTGKGLNARMAELTAKSEIAMSNYMGDLTAKREEFISGNRHSNMSGNANGVTHHQRMKPIIINIENTDHLNALVAPVFSKYENLVIPFNGQADIDGTVATAARGIIITVQDYSLTELKDLTANKPFTLSKLRYKFGDATQLDMPFKIRQKQGSSVANDPYYPSIARALENQVNDTLVDEDFFMKVDGGSTLLVKLAPAISSTVSRKVQLVVYIDSETDIASALANQSVVSTFAAGK